MVAILILLVLVVVIIIAAVDLVVPGPPQIFLIQYDTPVSGCSGSTGHYVYSFKFALMNEGGPAFVTVRAYLDGAPALINGQNESMQYYVPGPHGAAYGDFFISAADCGMHAPTIAVTSVGPT